MDDRDFPLTMNKPERHQFDIGCRCDSCKAIVDRQMACQKTAKGHSMIGKSPVCVHCGCTEASKSQYDMMRALAHPWNGMGFVSTSPRKR